MGSSESLFSANLFFRSICSLLLSTTDERHLHLGLGLGVAGIANLRGFSESFCKFGFCMAIGGFWGGLIMDFGLH